MTRVDATMRLFAGEHACSQAVLLAFAPSVGLDEDAALRIAAGFSAGMRLGRTCGAVSGAIMVLGMARGDASCATREGRAAVAAAVETFAARFRERVGATDCPDIIGVDIRVPEVRQRAHDEGLFAERCAPAVRAAAEILDEMFSGG